MVGNGAVQGEVRHVKSYWRERRWDETSIMSRTEHDKVLDKAELLISV